MKFLVAIDSSEIHQTVIQKILGLVAPSQAEVVIMTAIEPMSSYYSKVILPTGDWVGWQGVADVELEKKLMESGRTLLNEAEKIFKEAGVTCQTRLDIGSPRETICTVADEEKPDFLVVGSRGLGTVERMMLGSVSDYVVHHCLCPVIVVR